MYQGIILSFLSKRTPKAYLAHKVPDWFLSKRHSSLVILLPWFANIGYGSFTTLLRNLNFFYRIEEGNNQGWEIAVKVYILAVTEEASKEGGVKV